MEYMNPFDPWTKFLFVLFQIFYLWFFNIFIFDFSNSSFLLQTFKFSIFQFFICVLFNVLICVSSNFPAMRREGSVEYSGIFTHALIPMNPNLSEFVCVETHKKFQ